MEILLIVILLLLLGGFGYVVFLVMFKKREVKEEREKHIPTTQEQLPFDYIRGGIVKLKTGGYRVAVELPSINIDLMEAGEKQAILEQYRGILNSIDFPFQILQQSRIVDISEYLETLNVLRRGAKTSFARKQLESYTSYLEDLIKSRSILTKRFYLVIPYDEKKDKKKEKLEKKKKKTVTKTTTNQNDVYEEEQRFDRARKQLYSRASLIERSFRRFDITPVILEDNDLLDLFYTSYNKDRAVYQPLKDKNPSDFTSLRVATKESNSNANKGGWL